MAPKLLDAAYMTRRILLTVGIRLLTETRYTGTLTRTDEQL